MQLPLEMGIMSDEDVDDMLVVEVLQAGAFQYNNPEDPESPIEQGVHDKRMGVADEGRSYLQSGFSRTTRQTRVLGILDTFNCRAHPKTDVSWDH